MNKSRLLFNDLKEVVTKRSVIRYVLTTLVAVFLAVVIFKLVGFQPPLWFWALGLALAAYLNFGLWLKPDRYSKVNSDEDSSGASQ